MRVYRLSVSTIELFKSLCGVKVVFSAQVMEEIASKWKSFFISGEDEAFGMDSTQVDDIKYCLIGRIGHLVKECLQEETLCLLKDKSFPYGLWLKGSSFTRPFHKTRVVPFQEHGVCR
ncbi:hypothetical protein PanWU01x14_214620 [Parasponia andersonii]|uniref:Uncharacterized protein n=1 Tax=Parasponia andersonii TaxID=3476 RepID=A0A2P5BS94_PARAD|nr:hypothetical protein PanWU01x14_214620 [Parasponia andersonii]